MGVKRTYVGRQPCNHTSLCCDSRSSYPLVEPRDLEKDGGRESDEPVLHLNWTWHTTVTDIDGYIYTIDR